MEYALIAVSNNLKIICVFCSNTLSFLDPPMFINFQILLATSIEVAETEVLYWIATYS